MVKMYLPVISLCLLHATLSSGALRSQQTRVGKLTEAFAWKQLTYNINGNILDRDRFSVDGLDRQRLKRQSDFVYFADNDDKGYDTNTIRYPTPQYNYQGYNFSNNRIDTHVPTPANNDDPTSFFIQYNNVPMGVEKVGNRLFVTVPRRRHGIPSTLNYIDLTLDVERSPNLRPYPSLREGRTLASVYRTRADECGRLWMVDTGLLEIPDQPQQVQPPAIVVFDLRTDRQILRYELKESDLPANNTPTGLASITVDTSNGCANAFAYIPDLTTFGIVVFSLRENDSWRVTHSYMHFNPLAVNLRIAGQRFQWSDGIFSIALGQPDSRRCRTAYFHPMISTQEFSVSTCVLNNRTASTDSDYWTTYSIVGERGEGTQSTMHDMHPNGVLLYADVGRDSVSCWNTNTPLSPNNVAVLGQDQDRLSYPADLHVNDGEVWVMANRLPRFSYASLDTNEYNFYIYRGNVEEMIYDTVCSTRSRPTQSSSYNNRYN